MEPLRAMRRAAAALPSLREEPAADAVAPADVRNPSPPPTRRFPFTTARIRADVDASLRPDRLSATTVTRRAGLPLRRARTPNGVPRLRTTASRLPPAVSR